MIKGCEDKREAEGSDVAKARALPHHPQIYRRGKAKVPIPWSSNKQLIHKSTKVPPDKEEKKKKATCCFDAESQLSIQSVSKNQTLVYC